MRVRTKKRKASNDNNDHKKISGIRSKLTRPMKDTSGVMAFLAELNKEEEKKMETERRITSNETKYQDSMRALQEAGREIANDIRSFGFVKQNSEEQQSPLNDPSVRDVFRLCIKYTFEENYQSAASLQEHWRQSLLQLLGPQSSSAKTDVDHLACVICKFAPPMSDLKALKPRSAMKKFYEVLEHQLNIEKKEENEADKELTAALNKIQSLKNEVAFGDSSDEDDM